MKCPIDSVEMQKAEQEGIEIDYCPHCRGVWLDRGELEKIVDRAVAEFEEQFAPEGPEDYQGGPGGYRGGFEGPGGYRGGPQSRGYRGGPEGGGPSGYYGGPEGPAYGGRGEWEGGGPESDDRGPQRRRSIFDIFNI